MTRALRNVVFYTLATTVICTSNACKKKDHNDMPDTPAVTGAITGSVQTWDDKLNKTDDAGGITVSLSNSTDSSTTTTDATGNFKFNNLPSGKYNLVFSKVGYGTTKIQGVSHTAGGTQSPTVVPVLNFGKIATTAVTRLSLYDTLYHRLPGVRLRYGFSPGPKTTNIAYARYFFGTDSAVSSTHYTAYDTLLTFRSYTPQSGYTFTDLAKFGFTTGQTVYIRMYGDSYVNNSYVDSTTGVRIFPNVNPASPKGVAVRIR